MDLRKNRLPCAVAIGIQFIIIIFSICACDIMPWTAFSAGRICHEQSQTGGMNADSG